MGFLDNAITWIGHDPATTHCPECDHTWRADLEAAAEMIDGAPARYADPSSRSV